MSPPQLRAAISNLPPTTELARRWTELESKARGSFFTSWKWIEALLNLSTAELKLFSAQADGIDIALAIIGHSHTRQYGQQVDRLHLNQSGSPSEDIIYPEFNDILCDHDWKAAIGPLFFSALNRSDYNEKWTELQLSGVSSTLVLRLESAARLERGRPGTLPTPYVDLHQCRVRHHDYLSCLSANTRFQIRRSMRLFERDYGSILMERIECPAGIEAALEKMYEFHRVKFAARTENSAFDNPFFLNFLMKLLLNHRSTQSGSGVDLLELKAGSTILGYLVILVYGGMAANYQTGFKTVSDNRLKPGLIAHALAVQHYADCNMDTYQFLAGEQQYKKSLATNSGELHWVKLHRPTTSYRLIRSIRRLKSAVTA